MYIMDYIVCIPSYKRAKICNERTLATLSRHNIDPTKVYVYVANQAEYELYKDTLNRDLYNEIRVGELGLINQRQFISNQWSLNQYILFFDDDVEEIYLSLTPHTSLDEFITHAFSECIKYKSYIWGVYPVLNPYFRERRRELNTELNYISGAFYGIINRPNYKAIQLSINDGNKEDVERSLKYFINDGIVLRFNKVGFKTKYYGTDGGGLGRFKERLIPMANASLKLKEMYGDYGKIKVRKNGMTEFVLKKIKSTLLIL